MSVAGSCPAVPCGPVRRVPLQLSAGAADSLCMYTTACRAVAQAGLAAATASLDDEAQWPLLLVAGWLATAADLMAEANLRVEVLA